MPVFLIILTFLISITSFSATRVQFFPGDRQAMVIITPADQFGNNDSDSTDLYQIMNVAEQDTMLGRGKAIVTSQRDFNLVCGEYKNQCQIILSTSANVKISSRDKKMSFKVMGDDAATITSLFKLNEKGEAYFKATDKVFELSGNSGSFNFKVE